MSDSKPILILGAGINGAALARELLLNGVPVCLVDRGDLSSGTTAYSSRLIHGGLRYLEYGEFDLVKESLEERTRLLRLAPHHVRPLRIFIPVTNRFGGLLASARRFLHLEGRTSAIREPARGLWLVRLGLRFYDAYARDPTLPHHAVHRLHDPDVPLVDPKHYLRMCSYYDAQIRFPERFVVSLLEDARRIAADRGVEFSLYTYHTAERHGSRISVRPAAGSPGAAGSVSERPTHTLEPSAIVNATGAWVDQTLRQLDIPSRRLIGGTKGSHILTHHDKLRRALRGQALYGEAVDGRPIFVLPFGDATLIGTTDIKYDGDPRDAVASREEIDYLIRSVNFMVRDAKLTADDVSMHYSGVRPLPSTDNQTTASITRRHWLEEHAGHTVPVFSIVGGKLTTCRSLAEEAAATVLGHLGRTVQATSRERFLPGGESHPQSLDALTNTWQHIARTSGLTLQQIETLWSWFGTRTEGILQEVQPNANDLLHGTLLPRAIVRWIIDHEWAECLEDLVERRLMLLFHDHLTLACLNELADMLVAAGKLDQRDRDQQVAQTIDRLEHHFGKTVCRERATRP